MIGDRERLERTFELFEMPEPALERLVRRRERKRRNERIGAGLVALLVSALAVGAIVRAFPSAKTPAHVTSPQPSLTSIPTVVEGGRWSGLWPQTSRADAREAQLRADAGDPDFVWQTDPQQEALIATRFATEVLGWKGALYTATDYVEEPGIPVRQDWDAEAVLWYVLRCGGPNPLYPNDDRAGNCAPTIDATHYEVVEVRGEQLIRGGPGGIWLVTDWREVPGRTVGSAVQKIPRSLDEARAIMTRYLAARLDGSAAERLVTCCASDQDVQLNLYETRGGSPYMRYEFNEMGRSAEWPDGAWMFRVTLYAADGTVVTEWPYAVGPKGGSDKVSGCCYFQIRETGP